jgi:hypothetical protein
VTANIAAAISTSNVPRIHFIDDPPCFFLDVASRPGCVAS